MPCPALDVRYSRQAGWQEESTTLSASGLSETVFRNRITVAEGRRKVKKHSLKWQARDSLAFNGFHEYRVLRCSVDTNNFPYGLHHA